MTLVPLERLRFPCTGYVLQCAERYARASLEHTHVYAGWDNDNKYDRIKTGIFGQEWLRCFCKANEIECSTDTTSEKESDQFDLNICGDVFDVKTSRVPELWPQVGAHLDGKADAFFFLECDAKFRYITMRGWVLSGDVFLKQNFVPKGHRLPGTQSLLQRYDHGSYFVKDSELFEVEDFVGRYLPRSLAIRSRAA